MSVVNLQSRASALATRLGSFQYFLEAARELLTADNLSSSQFRRHSRKIIRLIEIAEKSLAAFGVPIYSFLSCPPNKMPFRAAYVDLLLMLEQRSNDVDILLEGRVRRLLSPLHSTLTMPFNSSGPPTRTPATAKIRQPITEPGPSMNAIPADTTSSSLMPPPDSLPRPAARTPTPRTHGRRGRRRLWRVEIRPLDNGQPFGRPPSRLPDTETEQENTLPSASPRIIRPPPRRFGIFCTGKMTMHQYREPAKHVRTIVPLKE